MRMPVTQFGTVSERLVLSHPNILADLSVTVPFFFLFLLLALSLGPVLLAIQMEFKRFTEILQVGSEFSKGLLSEWDSKGELPTGLEGDVTNQKAQKRGQSIRRNSI